MANKLETINIVNKWKIVKYENKDDKTVWENKIFEMIIFFFIEIKLKINMNLFINLLEIWN